MSLSVGRPAGMEPYSDESELVKPGSLDELIVELNKVFSYQRVNVDYVKLLMESYKSKPSEWKTFAKFDRYRYTRNLVDEGNGKFNLMILCWNEGQGSSIHSHANSHCFLKVLAGEISEDLYDWPGEEVSEEKMKKRETHQYTTGAVTYINDSIGLHRVENPSHSNKAVTLHLYSPPFQKCQCFDQRTGHKTESMLTFWSQYGKRTHLTIGDCRHQETGAENS